MRTKFNRYKFILNGADSNSAYKYDWLNHKKAWANSWLCNRINRVLPHLKILYGFCDKTSKNSLFPTSNFAWQCIELHFIFHLMNKLKLVFDLTTTPKVKSNWDKDAFRLVHTAGWVETGRRTGKRARTNEIDSESVSEWMCTFLLFENYTMHCGATIVQYTRHCWYFMQSFLPCKSKKNMFHQQWARAISCNSKKKISKIIYPEIKWEEL